MNEVNAYTQFGGKTLSYDKNGNLIADGKQHFEYDALNRLIGVKDESGQVIAHYAYDAENRRIKKVLTHDTQRTTHDFIYDGWQEIAEYANGKPVREFVFGQKLDEPIAMLDFKENQTEAETYFYQTDRLGSVTGLTDRSGAVVARYRYDAYGDLVKDKETAEKVSNPFRYTGRYFDEETGLYYYRNRYYSPELGRFITKDPLQYVDGPNMYSYVMNNPLNGIDPMGTEKMGPAAGDSCSANSSNNYATAFTGFFIPNANAAEGCEDKKKKYPDSWDPNYLSKFKYQLSHLP